MFYSKLRNDGVWCVLEDDYEILVLAVSRKRDA